jgi:hypothetical protein
MSMIVTPATWVGVYFIQIPFYLGSDHD